MTDDELKDKILRLKLKIAESSFFDVQTGRITGYERQLKVLEDEARERVLSSGGGETR